MTSLTLATPYGQYQVSLAADDLTFTDLFELGILPLLRAAGYSERLIEDYFDISHPKAE